MNPQFEAVDSIKHPQILSKASNIYRGNDEPPECLLDPVETSFINESFQDAAQPVSITSALN